MIDKIEGDKIVDTVSELLLTPNFVVGEIALAEKLGISIISADLFFKSLLCVLVSEGKVILVKKDA